MNTQESEAYRLAKSLELIARYPNVRINQTDPGIQKEAATELRRLQQSEYEGWRYANELEQERKRLHEFNQELVGALLECVEDSEQAVTDYVLTYGEKHRPQRLEAMRYTVRKARAALAKANGSAAQTGETE